MPAGDHLRELLASAHPLIVPGVYDALTARLAEFAGFTAVYLSGASVSYSRLGKPDVGLVGADEMVEAARLVIGAVRVPVIVDIDNGYGSVHTLMRVVSEMARLGAAAIQIEDQAFPKRCGHLEGKQVVGLKEMLARLQAAQEARAGADMLIIARTDSRAVFGLEEAIHRGSAFAEAGADMVFVEAPESLEELDIIASKIKAPLVANMVEGGRTPLVTAAELAQIGYSLVIYPGAIARAVAKASLDLLDALKREGTTATMLDHMLSFRELNEILGLTELQQLEDRFL